MQRRGRSAEATPAAAPTNGHEQPVTLIPEGGRAFKKRSRAGIPITLPGSGAVALLKRPSLMAMSLKSGYVPNPISDSVLRWIAEHDDVLAKLTLEQQIENYRDNAGVFVEIAAMCFVHPRLILDRAVDDDDDDEIAPGDLSDRDYTFIVFRFVEGEAAELAPFLEPARPRVAASAR